MFSRFRPSAPLALTHIYVVTADVLGCIRQPLGLRERNARALLVRATGAELLARKRRECRRVLLSFVMAIVW